MAKKTSKVQRNQLYLAEDAKPVCLIDTSDWFAWLEAATSFRYHTQQQIAVAHGYTRPMRPISVRKEKRQRGYLWYAYIRTHGQLYKRYLGKSTALTQARLDEVATLLNEIW